MKYGVIDVGGGLRGIYGAGVLDHCWRRTSASISASAFRRAAPIWRPIWQASMGGTSPLYDEYSFRREYMSVHNLIHKHSYLDLGYVYGTSAMQAARIRWITRRLPAARQSSAWWPLMHRTARRSISPRQTSTRTTTASSWHPAASRSSTSPASSTACLILMRRPGRPRPAGMGLCPRLRPGGSHPDQAHWAGEE